jgi:formyltetrahydrofolate hydrolase
LCPPSSAWRRIGGHPYRRANVSGAKEGGVKLASTTPHDVKKDLDDAPISEHDVVRVEHHRHASMTWCVSAPRSSALFCRGRCCDSVRTVIRYANQTVVF